MPYTHVAFLRAVNVGKRRYPMAELRTTIEAAGFTDVATHIQTGNLRVTTPMRSPAKVAAVLEETMLADRGFEVPVVMFTPRELAALSDAAEAVREDSEFDTHYVTLLREAPGAELVAEIEGRDAPGEHLRVVDRAVHLMLSRPYHEVSASNASLERSLGMATTRNLTVIRALVAKWCG